MYGREALDRRACAGRGPGHPGARGPDQRGPGGGAGPARGLTAGTRGRGGARPQTRGPREGRRVAPRAAVREAAPAVDVPRAGCPGGERGIAAGRVRLRDPRVAGIRCGRRRAGVRPRARGGPRAGPPPRAAVGARPVLEPGGGPAAGQGRHRSRGRALGAQPGHPRVQPRVRTRGGPLGGPAHAPGRLEPAGCGAVPGAAARPGGPGPRGGGGPPAHAPGARGPRAPRAGRGQPARTGTRTARVLLGYPAVPCQNSSVRPSGARTWSPTW